MSELSPPHQETSSKGVEMAFTAEAVSAEMQGHVGAVVALSPDSTRKAALQFAATVLRLPFSRVKCLFYGEARRIEAYEADKIRAYVYAADKLIKAKADYEKTCAEFIAKPAPLDRVVAHVLVVADGKAATPERVATPRNTDRGAGR